jgi:hypothetical protein
MFEQGHNAKKRICSARDTLGAFLQIQDMRAESLDGFFDRVFSRYH